MARTARGPHQRLTPKDPPTHDRSRPKLTPEQVAERLEQAREVVRRHARDPDADSPEVMYARALCALFPEGAAVMNVREGCETETRNIP